MAASPTLGCREWVENSTASRSAWLAALRSGSLPKSIDNKDVVYSHLKALSSRQFGRSNLFPNISPIPFDDKEEREKEEDEKEETEKDIEDINIADLEASEKRFQPDLTSPVILENLLRPPEDVTEAFPAMFTINDFFNYLGSDEWAETVRLRVVGGELLKIINTALLLLEKRRLVNLHCTSALASNRVKKEQSQVKGEESVEEKVEKLNESMISDALTLEKTSSSATKAASSRKLKTLKSKKDQKDVEVQFDENTEKQEGDVKTEIEEPLKRSLELPSAYQTDPQWVYEKLALDIIFFERTDKSNIPFITPEFTDFDYCEDFPAPVPLPRALSRQPHCYKMHRVDRMALPPHEGVGPWDYIAQLEAEVGELVAIKEEKVRELWDETKRRLEEAKGKAGDKSDKSDKGKGKKEGFVEEVPPDVSITSTIDDVAETPFLEVSAPVVNSHKNVSKTNSRRVVAEAKKTSRKSTIYHQENSSEEISSKKSGDSTKRETGPQGSRQFEPASNRASRLIVADDRSQSVSRSLMNLSVSETDSISGSSGSSWMLDAGHAELDPDNFRQLTLTRDELYVSSLYAPREENRRSAAEKLVSLKEERAARNTQLAKQNLAAAVKNAKGDLYSSFKHLARQKEKARLAATRPKVPPLRLPTIAGASKSAPARPRLTCAHGTTWSQTRPTHSKQINQGREQQYLPPLNSQQHDFRNIKKNGTIQPDRGQRPVRSREVTDAQLWERYRQLEDVCEIESALDNKLERGLLERWPAPVKTAPETAMLKVKDKGQVRNKSKNRVDEEEDINANFLDIDEFSENEKAILSKHPVFNSFLSLYEENKVRITSTENENFTGSPDNPKSDRLNKQRRKRRVWHCGYPQKANMLMQYLISVRRIMSSEAWWPWACTLCPAPGNSNFSKQARRRTPPTSDTKRKVSMSISDGSNIVQNLTSIIQSYTDDNGTSGAKVGVKSESPRNQKPRCVRKKDITECRRYLRSIKNDASREQFSLETTKSSIGQYPVLTSNARKVGLTSTKNKTNTQVDTIFVQKERSFNQSCCNEVTDCVDKDLNNDDSCKTVISTRDLNNSSGKEREQKTKANANNSNISDSQPSIKSDEKDKPIHKSSETNIEPGGSHNASVNLVDEETEDTSAAVTNILDEGADQRFSVAMTVSEIFEQDIQCYVKSCPCDECQGQASYLADLRPGHQALTTEYGCPTVLGRLRRNFNFLAAAKQAGQEGRSNLDPSGRVHLPKRVQVFDAAEIGQKLLSIMDGIMIRKEILTSSRGFTYTTITFGKKGVPC